MSLKPKKAKVYAPRVAVWADNRYLYRTHAEHAQQMCSRKEAVPDLTGRRINRISLSNPASIFTKRTGPATPANAKQYGTKQAVFFQILGYSNQRSATYTFVPLSQDDYNRLRAEHNYEVLIMKKTV